MRTEKVWRQFTPDNDMPALLMFLWKHFAPIGIAVGGLVSGTVWLAVEVSGFGVLRIVNHEWWGIFPVLLMLALVLVSHELLHFAFSRWRHSRVVFVYGHCSFAVLICGEYRKWHYVLCVMAPTVIISGLILPALYFDNPYLMAAAIVNLSGSGLDWVTAYLAITILPGDRIYLDGEHTYVPIDRDD